MDLPTTLFSTQSLLSLAGAVVATALVPNVLATVVKLSPRTLRLIALAVAMILAFLMAYMDESAQWFKWIVAFFNGLLIYLSALGANETLSRGLEKTPPPTTFAETALDRDSGQRKFFRSWF